MDSQIFDHIMNMVAAAMLQGIGVVQAWALFSSFSMTWKDFLVLITAMLREKIFNARVARH